VTTTLPAAGPVSADQRRTERRRRLAVVELPLLRLAGSALLSLGVFLHDRYVLQSTSLVPWVNVTALLGAYCLTTWIALALCYRLTPPRDLTVVAFAGDMIVWTYAIYWTGAEQSWLFFILLMRVADQTQTTLRRCLLFAIFGTLCYVMMLAWVVVIDGRPIVLSMALVKTAFLLMAGLYIAMAARTAESRRARLTEAIRTSRSLVTQLEEQSAALRVASAAKSEFVTNMSHEMRTPLHGILGMLQLAVERTPSADVRRQLDLARRSAEALLRTIDDILDFSKIEARRIELEPVYFDLRDMVTDVCKALGVTAMMKGLDFAFSVDASVPDRVWGDPMRVRQVLVNLIGNAIKFTATGEVIARTSVTGTQLTFTVTDTGIGIDPLKRDQIFDPFAQADATHARRFGGTGLGLSIVSRLVDAMGGAISVESEPGRGSVFRATLPLVADIVSITRLEWERGLTGMRVVVIEPHAASREILGEILRGRGMVPELYATVAAAMQPPLREAFACVVADGPALAASSWTPAVPLVQLVSRLASFDDDVMVVTRPVGERELIDAIGLATGLTDRAVVYTLEPESAPIEPLRVLVVDDHPVNQEFAAEVVRRAGHEVTTASGGEEALALLESRPFDVVLMDVQMPGIDGLEVTRRFRAAHPESEMRIVGVTAHSSRQDRARCLDAGMDDVVVKPVSRARIADVLRDPVIPGVSATLLVRVREAFQKQTPRLIASMRESLSRGDAEALARDAHTMKGALSNFGPGDALDAATALEVAARTADFDRAAEELAALEVGVREVEERLA
jgi:signal transduction histidine kinase/CheY-like chemotaxis protein